MKTHSPRAGLSLQLSLLAAALLLPGCKPQSSAPPPPTPVAVSAEKTSFNEVTALLDRGGSSYAYLSTAQWLENLSNKLQPWRELIASATGMSEPDRQGFTKAFDALAGVVRQSGVESISGVGFSGIAIEPGFYRSKLVVHHAPGAGKGYVWTLFGTQPHPFDFADWLPTNTAWASSADLDVPGVWNAIRQHVKQSGVPDADRALDTLTRKAEQASGMKFEELLGSLDGHFAFALTLDPTKTVPVPMPDGQGLQLPEPGLILAMKVKDDRWFEWADRTLAANPQVINGDSTAAGLRMRTMPMPLPLPLEVRASVARAGDYLWITSHDRLMQQMLQVKAGKVPGLRSTAEFKKLMDGLPAQGNQFAFASEGLQELVNVIQRTALATAGRTGTGPSPALMQKLFGTTGKIASASVSVVGPEGWLSVGHGHQDPAGAIMVSALVAPTAVLAGMMLPALAKAKGKAQSISCVNNLKQIGLATRIYAADHDGKFPPDLLSMKDEIVSPRVLICPINPAAAQAQSLSWESLQPDAVSYDYLGSGKSETDPDPQAVLCRCRFHGHTCRMDGSVQMSMSSPQ